MASLSKLPKAGSVGEEAFSLHCRVEGLKPEREYLFHPKRRWRFDFAWPDPKIKLAVEVEGGIWSGGRHNRALGFEQDAVKYAHAAILGYRVIRVSTAQVMSGQAIQWTLEALK